MTVIFPLTLSSVIIFLPMIADVPLKKSWISPVRKSARNVFLFCFTLGDNRPCTREGQRNKDKPYNNLSHKSLKEQWIIIASNEQSIYAFKPVSLT